MLFCWSKNLGKICDIFLWTRGGDRSKAVQRFSESSLDWYQEPSLCICTFPWRGFIVPTQAAARQLKVSTCTPLCLAQLCMLACTLLASEQCGRLRSVQASVQSCARHSGVQLWCKAVLNYALYNFAHWLAHFSALHTTHKLAHYIACTPPCIAQCNAHYPGKTIESSTGSLPI